MRLRLPKMFRLSMSVFAECEVCGDVDGAETMGTLSDGRVACWHCAERAGEFCIVEAGLPEWRGDHLSRCVRCQTVGLN